MDCKRFRRIGYSICFSIGLILISGKAFAWPTGNYPSSLFTASQDILAASSDSHNVGVSTNIWQSVYHRNSRLAYRAEAPTTVASFGAIFASTDGHAYFQNAAGTVARID